MSPEAFAQLDERQQVTMLLAANIRNELEDFHVDHIADRFMPELNSTIRYAIYDFFERVMNNDREVGWLALIAPAYWEVPGRDPKPTFSGEYLWDGKPLPKDEDA